MLGENTALSQNRDDGQGRTPTVLCDRFVLEARLNHGRLGTMYRARDRLRAQDGRSYVAVLVLPSEVARSPEQLAAFEHALADVRMLSHPNIVRIFSLERDGDSAFLVLEWVDGESLRSVIDSLAPETVCEADALGVVRAVGNALVYAHARGIVHGDIRPENVLVTERGEVRLLFASACLARTGPFEIGPRDDVRGLAALAYELMAGAPPPIGGLYPRGKADEPEPIEGVSRKRWKALRSAMSVRDGRISSVRALLAALDLPEPRAPRRGSRPDRIRGGNGGLVKRVATAVSLAAVVVALLAAGLLLWIERGEELPDVDGVPASVESGADRAAEATREGLSSARQGLERAGDALAGLWGEIARTGGSDATDESVNGESAVRGGSDGDASVGGSGGDAGAARGTAAPDESEPSAAAGSAIGNERVRDTELLAPRGTNDTGPSDEADARVESAAGGGSARTLQDLRPEAAMDGAEDSPRTEVASDSVDPQADATQADATQADATRADATSRAASGADTSVQVAPTSRDEPRSAASDGTAERSAEAAARPADATVTGAASRLVFSRGEYSVSESEGVAAIEVERANSQGDISFVWWTRDGSATSGDDYADLGRSIEQISDGEAITVLYVPITSDSIVEERTEYFEIHLGMLSAEGNQNGALESARVIIIDDDR